MRKLFLLMALFATTAFVACSKDDENGGGNNTSIVNRIIQQNEDGTTLIWEFDYDNQGRVVQMTYGDQYTKFAYSEGKVIITELYMGKTFVCNALLNEQGYITTLTGFDDNISNYSYDKNGYLSILTWGDDGNLQCIWNNGDLILEHVTGSDPRDFNYEYTNYPAKQNIDIFAFVYGYCHVDDPEFIGAVGLVGRKSAHLIKSATVDSNQSFSYEYEFDGDGNPTKVIESSEYKTWTYKILYK